MDVELEDALYKNNTDDLNDFDYDLTEWDTAQDVIEIIFSLVGLAANIIIILMIWRNKRMRTRTNLLFMNYAINNACFLVSNVHVLTAIFELFGEIHLSSFLDCFVQYMDIGFQINELIFLLTIVSTTLITNKKLETKWLITAVYSLISINFVASFVWCFCEWWSVTYFLCFILYLITAGVIIFKELNACYKKYYKKHPIGTRTRFRLNLGGIYVVSWAITILCYIVASDNTYQYFAIIAGHVCMASMYMLVYIVLADKNFHICMLNLFKCKGADAYDVDATITFAEEDDADVESAPPAQNAIDNRVSIQFVETGHENPINMHVQVQNANGFPKSNNTAA